MMKTDGMQEHDRSYTSVHVRSMRPLPPPGGGAPPEHGLRALLGNAVLASALLSCGLAQLAKPLAAVGWSMDRRPDWGLALSPGGMPSSHTAFVTGAATALGVTQGTGSGLFALAVVLALVVAYDATGVRLNAGRHASVLNSMVAALPPGHPAAEHPILQETLGHTPVEVAAGAAVGVLVGLMVGGLAVVFS